MKRIAVAKVVVTLNEKLLKHEEGIILRDYKIVKRNRKKLEKTL